MKAEQAQLLELEFQLERLDRQRDRTGLRDQFESALRSRFVVGLSDAQKKLVLAGRVDQAVL